MMPLNDRLCALRRSGIRAYTSLAQSVPDCVMLTLGEPDFATPQPIVDAAIEALHAGQTHYAPNQGTQALRDAVAAYETARGMPCNAAQVLITAGATGALYTALTGLINAGDEVIVPTPAFSLYESIVTMAGGKVVPLHTQPDGFQIRAERLKAAITPKTRAIVLNSPNNPTGVVYDAQSLEAVKQAAAGKPIWLICDNVYQQLSSVPCPDLTCDDTLRGQVILCQSFSKPYAMTGWRVGYLVAPEAVTARLTLLSAAELACVPTFLQSACVTALQQDTSDMARAYAARRGFAAARLREMGLSFPEPQGAFYLFPDISRFGLSSDAFCTRMITQAHVAAVPGSCFGAEEHIRISCCAEDALARGLARMADFLKTL